MNGVIGAAPRRAIGAKRGAENRTLSAVTHNSPPGGIANKIDASRR
ncbi:MAG TPA: hypothetical protein VFS00_32595 [Polyangiaceae bacterium]|nr:hypothetical protein [Polyangiaceae bacterium]